MIKLFSPYIPKETSKVIADVLSSGQIAQGAKVDRFEKEFCRIFEVRYAVAVNSGTSALELAYELINLQPGDEVITTPLTCVATNLPLLRRGVKIVWADVLESTLNINPVDVHAKITPHTAAVVQVHLGGIAADVGKIHVPVISDAAQALGIFKGDYTACSFQAIKHITTGDGGMLVVNWENEYNKAKLLRWFGIDRERKVADNWEAYKTRMMCFDIELPGTKRHMNDIAASMGMLGLKYYNNIITHRKKLFDLYRYRIGEGSIEGIELVDGKENTYWLATILVEDRDDFARMMYDAEIETNVVQVRNDTYKIFGGMPADLPVLNSIQHKYLSLPIGMHITEDNVNYICDKIEKGWGV